MKKNVYDFLATLLGYLWGGTILLGSISLFMWVCRCFFRLVGVI